MTHHLILVFQDKTIMNIANLKFFETLHYGGLYPCLTTFESNSVLIWIKIQYIISYLDIISWYYYHQYWDPLLILVVILIFFDIR